MSTSSTMTADQAIAKAYLHATGKTTTLASSDAKYIRLLNIADSMQKNWMREPGVDWMSLYNTFDFGKVVATTQPAPPNKALYPGDPDELRKISQREGDSVIISANDGSKNYWPYDIVTPDKALQYIYHHACYFLQTDLYFTEPFLVGDAKIGAEIFVPGFGFVDDITAGTNIIQVDDPMWLVYMMAAEYVRNDQVRRIQYPNLIALANERMASMRQDNGDQLQEIPIDLDLSEIDPNNVGAWN